MRRIVVGLLVALAAVYALGCVAGGIYMVEEALHPAHKVRDRNKEAKYLMGVAAGFTDVETTAPDGTALRGSIALPRSQNGDVVIAQHGHAHDRDGVLAHTELLLRHGYIVLLPDL